MKTIDEILAPLDLSIVGDRKLLRAVVEALAARLDGAAPVDREGPPIPHYHYSGEPGMRGRPCYSPECPDWLANPDQFCDDAGDLCEWPGCSASALCSSGNFGGKLVCSEHFKITNGIAADPLVEGPPPRPAILSPYYGGHVAGGDRRRASLRVLPECGKALEAGRAVDPKVLIAARNYLVEHRNDELGPVLLIKDLYDAAMDLGERLQRNAKEADEAARELLFLAAIEGMSCLSRGGKGCVFRAVELLRPDIAKLWGDMEDPHDLLYRFFPEAEDVEDVT